MGFGSGSNFGFGSKGSGSGGGSVSGNGVAKQVAVWNGPTSIAGYPTMTFDKDTAIAEIVGNQYVRGLKWKQQANTPDTGQFNSMTWGNGVFVVVDKNSDGFMWSPDGVNFNDAAPPIAGQWNSVCFGNGLFVACSIGSEATPFIYSTDGKTWLIANGFTGDPTTGSFISVAYGNGKFVSLSNASDVGAYSYDGINWVLFNTGLPEIEIQMICYGNGLFVAVGISSDGSGEFAIYSFDGINFNVGSSGISLQANFLGVCYGNGKFVAVASDADDVETQLIAYSIDGQNWLNANAPKADQWIMVTYGEGLFVAVSGANISTEAIMTSIDGITWVIRDAGVIGEWYALAYGNGMFVAISSNDDGLIVTSGFQYSDQETLNNLHQGTQSFLGTIEGSNGIFSAGISWKQYSIGANTGEWQNIVFGNGIFMALGTDGAGNAFVATTVDGQNWTPVIIDAAPSAKAIAYGNGIFVIMTEVIGSKNTYYSLDGLIWHGQDLGNTDAMESITYGNGQFVAVGDNDTVYTSNDGLRWIPQSGIGGANDWLNVFFGDGIYVATGQDKLMISSDGITWTAGTPTGVGNNIPWIAGLYAQGTYFVISNEGQQNSAMMSVDAVDWEPVNIPINGPLSGVAYGNGLFLIVSGIGGTQSIATSSDLVNWTIRNASDINVLSGVCYGNGMFVAVCANQSQPQSYVSGQMQVDQSLIAVEPTIGTGSNDGATTGLVNASAATANIISYSRTGNVVTVFGTASITSVLAGIASFDLSVPTNPEFTNNQQAGGAGTALSGIVLLPVNIISKATSDVVTISINAAVTTTYNLSFQFSYLTT